MEIAAPEQNWRLSSSPIVEQKHWDLFMQSQKCTDLHMKRQTPYFTVAKFRQYLNED